MERQTLHRSLQTLGQLLLELDRYRDLAAALAKSQKNVAKAQREVASCFGDKVEPGARNSVIGKFVAGEIAFAEAELLARSCVG